MAQNYEVNSATPLKGELGQWRAEKEQEENIWFAEEKEKEDFFAEAKIDQLNEYSVFCLFEKGREVEGNHS